MQTLAVLRLLRRSGVEPVGAIDRERVSEFDGERVLPMSAWWKFDGGDWPPAPGIVPIPMGVHIASPALVAGHEDWWRACGPIGARDAHTHDMLTRHGIGAWHSGCVTLTLDDWTPDEFTREIDREKRLADALVLPLPPLDLPAGTTVLVDTGTTRGHDAAAPHSVRVSHQLNPARRINTLTLLDRLYLAERLLLCYHQAAAVIGTRLHAYLPALAMGRPAVLLGPPDARTKDCRGPFDAAALATAFRTDFGDCLACATSISQSLNPSTPQTPQPLISQKANS